MLRFDNIKHNNIYLLEVGGRVGYSIARWHTCTDRLIVNKNAKDLYITSCCYFIELMMALFPKKNISVPVMCLTKSV